MSVTVYTTPSCMGCKSTKKHLDRMRVPHRIIDLTVDEAAAATLVRMGYRTAPVVAVERDGTLTMWEGYRPDALDALADLAAGGEVA